MNNHEIKNVIDILVDTYPDANCELEHRNPFELLIATVLSAQTTDKKVNEITKELFKEYSTPKDFLKLTREELEEKIKKIGLYRNKSKNILLLCKELEEKFGSQVPNDFNDLTSLPGVGRKTANVVLANAFKVPTIAVDTHVFRVSNRIGLVDASNVLKTEEQLQQAIPKELWILMHHVLIFHGRRCCVARKPKCEECTIKKYCKYYNEEIKPS
ncbi:endonuclease III [Clostridium botulinum]|uniref:Endonuclease III n=4 Tax=Clostridium botulinum TaxID=1491 RepID=A5HYA2_CLOBH|nr:endonuclease III [Clostridium botulinum]EKN41787.1 endonuclease III [Clostridium botulinum CFSAN001627]KRU24967.1 endonuclease III [Clostridium sporogenes]ABS34515.1 endonuclease III [Clostridium botulinum A str. ATCC 19397]ABS38884.1 endonuclease III [Clostridium botulinum A str. Hall]ACO87117.1 endonuclease III [Clostridium botulinum A2 str. Kyoto]